MQDLATFTKQEQVKAEKLEKETARKDEEDRKRKLVEEDEQARKRIAHVKQSLSFTMEWALAGHPSVAEVDDLVAAETKLKGNQELFARPFLVKKLDMTLDTLEKTMTSWVDSSTKHCVDHWKDQTHLACSPWHR